MRTVQRLPEILVHQIAAGEIVERPASVVKELVENALDASASRVTVKVEEGGKQLIRIQDDGLGMSRADAELAFEHHSTSKISSLEDLSCITTLGFRGEALPAIASVSRIQLRTRDTEAPEQRPGTEIRLQGGELKEIREISWPGGTEVIVEDLFFNTPARRKFLKTKATELSHISRQVIHYALAYPSVEFRLDHGSRNLLDAPRVSSLTDRAFQVFGESFLENLVSVDYSWEGVTVSGLTSLPHEQRSSAQSLYLFVNGRMVRDKVLTHAVRTAYRDLIPAASYPLALLFVQVDPAQLDVNVHPAKFEVRFRYSQEVHRAVQRAIESSLTQHRTTPGSVAHDLSLSAPHSNPAHGIKRSLESYLNRHSESAQGFDFKRFERFSQAPSLETVQVQEKELLSNLPDSLVAEGTEGEIPADLGRSPAVPIALGQFIESFVVAVDRQGVMVVDQHVAHERILYDRFLQAADKKGPPVQRLLVPETVELTAEQLAVSEWVLEGLNTSGFEIEHFGGNTVAIRGIPALARRLSAQQVVADVLQDLQTLDPPSADSPTREYSLKRLREKIAISVSCRAAIKINTPLGADRQQWLLDELFRCQNPYTCPHGRPILLRLELEEILKAFKRI